MVMSLINRPSASRGLFACAVVCCLALGAGCGRAGSAPTVPAAGRLVCGGRPLAGIDLVLTPEAGRRGFATTDANGRFTVTTFVRGDGAVPGRHVVTLWPNAAAAGPVEDSFAASATAAPADLPFAAKYSRTADTDLVIELGEKGSRSIELVLETAQR